VVLGVVVVSTADHTDTAVYVPLFRHLIARAVALPDHPSDAGRGPGRSHEGWRPSSTRTYTVSQLPANLLTRVTSPGYDPGLISGSPAIDP